MAAIKIMLESKDSVTLSSTDAITSKLIAQFLEAGMVAENVQVNGGHGIFIRRLSEDEARKIRETQKIWTMTFVLLIPNEFTLSTHMKNHLDANIPMIDVEIQVLTEAAKIYEPKAIAKRMVKAYGYGTKEHLGHYWEYRTLPLTTEAFESHVEDLKKSIEKSRSQVKIHWEWDLKLKYYETPKEEEDSLSA